LEEISVSRNLQRKLDEAEEDDDDDRLKIGEDVDVFNLGFTDLNPDSLNSSNEMIKLDFDEL
jgi:hypothetical protein